jgi:hypothetical protein
MEKYSAEQYAVINELFDIQKKHNDRWWDQERFEYDVEYRKNVAMHLCSGIIDQSMKLQNTFHWKKHQLDKSGEENYNSIDQTIDVIKYAIGMLILLGVDPKDFLLEYKLKSNTLDYKWDQEKKNLLNKKVIIFDIDGVVADYETAFITYVANREDWKLTDYNKTVNKLEQRKVYYFDDILGFTKSKEEQLKNDFISGGGFKILKPYETGYVEGNVIQLMRRTQLAGVKIVCLTARPYWLYKRIFSDTVSWFKDYGFKPDLLLFNKDKAEAIVDHVMPANILFALDDRDKHALEIAHLGIKVMMPARSYNETIKGGDDIIKFTDWSYYSRMLSQFNIDLSLESEV